MRTLLLILIQAVLLTLLAFWYQQNPGMLEIAWLGYHVQVSVAIFLILTLLLVGGFYGLTRLLLTIFHIPSFFRSRYAKYNQMRGIHAVEDSLVAFIAQDVKLLKKTGKYVGSFLKDSPLNFFFRGEAALLSGDFSKADALFKGLTKHDSMAFAGYYGLMKLALAQKDLPKAIAYGDLSLSQNQHALPVRKKIADLCLEAHQYDRALQELDYLLNLSPKSVSLMKKKAEALYHLSQELAEHDKLKEALSAVEKSLKMKSDNHDALLLQVALLRKLGKEKAASKALEKAWQIAPHVDFTPLYLETKSSKTDLENFKAIQRLVSFAPDHLESDLTLAHYAIAAQLWGPAHDALNRLLDKGTKTKAVYELMTDLEQAEKKK